jgi:predicted RNA-binding Zn-ribbon protein involved in translation (DUF1610 family)
MTEPEKLLPKEETPEILKPEALKAQAKPKEDWKKKYLDLEAKVAAQPEKSESIQSPKILPSPTEPQPPAHSHIHEACPTCQKSIGEHFVRPFDPFCPECGEKNPNFKSLAICDPAQGGCGAVLGTVEHAKTLEGCPNCGGKKAKEFKYK